MKEKMNKITLYHGTPDKIVVPTFGKGEKKHDYGRGFYLTESICRIIFKHQNIDKHSGIRENPNFSKINQ